MTRTAHHPHATPGFPVYCLDWVDSETLILGGGGGASRSGIENKLKLCKVSKDGRSVKYVDELALAKGEDAPMTMSVDIEAKKLITGVNAEITMLKDGVNKHCRVYSFENDKLAFVNSQQTLDTAWSDDYPYQKFTAWSPANLLAVGTTNNKVSILRFPSLDVLLSSFSIDGEELVDVQWGSQDGQTLVLATASNLRLFRVVEDDKKQSVKLHLLQTLSPIQGETRDSFRNVRFANVGSRPFLFATTNAVRSAKRGVPQKAHVYKFGLTHSSPSSVTEDEKTKKKKNDKSDDMKWSLITRREIASKAVTTFDVSADGRLVSYGCSDLSIGILDATTLAPLLKILHAHSFPPTALKFNPTANLLVSASADNTIRVIVVPSTFESMSFFLITIIFAILLAIVAFVMARQLGLKRGF